MDKINFKDLSTVNKIGVIGGWLYFLLTAVAFTIGFIYGVLYG